MSERWEPWRDEIAARLRGYDLAQEADRTEDPELEPALRAAAANGQLAGKLEELGRREAGRRFRFRFSRDA